MPTTAAAFAAAASAVWAEDTLAGLADTGTTLADGRELLDVLVSRIAFAADGLAFTLPDDDGDPPDFAALADDYETIEFFLSIVLPLFSNPQPPNFSPNPINFL